MSSMRSRTVRVCHEKPAYTGEGNAARAPADPRLDAVPGVRYDLRLMKDALQLPSEFRC